MIIAEFIHSTSAGCGHWEFTNGKGTKISADDNDVDIREALKELEKEEKE